MEPFSRLNRSSWTAKTTLPSLHKTIDASMPSLMPRISMPRALQCARHSVVAARAPSQLVPIPLGDPTIRTCQDRIDPQPSCDPQHLTIQSDCLPGNVVLRDLCEGRMAIRTPRTSEDVGQSLGERLRSPFYDSRRSHPGQPLADISDIDRNGRLQASASCTIVGDPSQSLVKSKQSAPFNMAVTVR